MNGRAIAVLRPHSRFHVHLSNGAHPVFIYSSLLRCLSNRVFNISVYSHKRASCVCLCIILFKTHGPLFLFFVHVIYGVLSSRPINCVHIRSYVLEYERIQIFAQLLSFYVSCLLTSTFLLGSLDVMSLFSLLADESGGVLPIIL